MSRDASGNYTLPSGNPVVGGTVIQSDGWANPTLEDIGNALTDSLSRSGKGGMLVPFQFVDGSVASPGISWVSEPSTGFYRAGSADMRATVSGADKARFVAAGLQDLRDSGWYRVASGKHFSADAETAGLLVTSNGLATTINYDNARALETNAGGGGFFATAGTDGFLGLTVSDARNADIEIKNATGYSILRQDAATNSLTLLGLTAAGASSQISQVLNYNGSVDSYWRNARKTFTTQFGMDVQGFGEAETRIGLRTPAGAEVDGVQFRLVTGSVYMDLAGAARSFNVRAAGITLLSGVGGGTCSLYTEGALFLRTATTAERASRNSGGMVYDAAGTARAVGYNALPTLTAGAARTIVAGDNGGKFRITGGTAMTVPTGLATDFTMVIQNNSGSSKALTASGTTLNWFSGFAVTTGNRTLANGAWVTITQRGATDVFDVAGAGIS